MNNELYLKTAFCCMACDGDIANAEIQLIKDYIGRTDLFNQLDVKLLLNKYIDAINQTGFLFLNSYLIELKNEEKTKEEEFQVVKIAIEIIEADKEIQYSEIKFFKKIRATLHLSDEEILVEYPDKEDYLLPDIVQQEYETILETKFNAIKID